MLYTIANNSITMAKQPAPPGTYISIKNKSITIAKKSQTTAAMVCSNTLAM